MGKANAIDVSNRYCLKVVGCSRLTVPPNCSTPFWDPIGGKCLCSATSCNFNDDSRPIGVRILFSLYLLVQAELRVICSDFLVFFFIPSAEWRELDWWREWWRPFSLRIEPTGLVHPIQRCGPSVDLACRCMACIAPWLHWRVYGDVRCNFKALRWDVWMCEGS